jgi:hypothetical protein
MRYILVCIAAFMLFALPAFAYDPPTEGVEDSIDIEVDIQAYMYFELTADQICFELSYDECYGYACDTEDIDYYICVNGDWYVVGMFIPDYENPDGGEYWLPWCDDMDVYVNDILMTEQYSTDYIAEGEMGEYDSDLYFDDDILPWELMVCADWCEKGDYTGWLYLELWDP